MNKYAIEITCIIDGETVEQVLDKIHSQITDDVRITRTTVYGPRGEIITEVL